MTKPSDDHIELDRRENLTDFDTHRMHKRLRVAGFGEAQADALVDQAVYGYKEVMERVATKEDLRLLKLELSSEIASSLRSLQMTVGFFAGVLGLVGVFLKFVG
jgi:hypothetical protein